MDRRIVVIDAPSNLGLRPPALGVVPGVYKLAGALRDQGIVARRGVALLGQAAILERPFPSCVRAGPTRTGRPGI